MHSQAGACHCNARAHLQRERVNGALVDQQHGACSM